MSKIGIIIKREYIKRVSRRSFILLTIFMPILFVALVFVPLWLSTMKGDAIKEVVILDRTDKYAPHFQDESNFHFITGTLSPEEYRKLGKENIYAILSITGDLLKDPSQATLYSEKQIPGELSRLVNRTLTDILEEEKINSYEIPGLKEIIEESKIRFSIQSIKWGQDGTESKSSAQIASVIGLIFTTLIYFFTIMYGAMVMQGVMEEKTNRIVEILISSVKPFDLMMGKIIGILFVGLTQLFIWGIIFLFLMGLGQLFIGDGIDMNALPQNGMMANQGAAFSQLQDNPAFEYIEIVASMNIPHLFISFIFYFIGGYLLYSSLFAAIGSAVDQQEDTQQFMVPVTVLMLFAFYTGIYSMENPDGPLAFWLSLFPFTSPVVMMVRMPFDVPVWQLTLSLALLFATAIGIVWLSARIYRVGILMYGKKPSLKEMWKWLSYK